MAPEKGPLMNISEAFSSGYRLCAILFIAFIPADAQKYDITPLVGGRYGGTMKLEQQGVSPRVDGHLADSVSFGVAAGVRIPTEDCEACGLLEFRWMRTDTHIGLKQNFALPPPVVTPFIATTAFTFLG
jgi:hypothetical protein